MQKYLTAADMVEVASPYGLTPKRLRNWFEAGCVVPVEGGEGTGDHRRFTLMQAVGIAVAAAAQNSAQGCVRSYVAVVTSAFAAADEAWLKAEFAKGRTHLVPTRHDGRPVLQAKSYDWVDVGAVYRDVLAKVAEIAARPVNASAAGRRRGLAASE